MAKRSSSSSRKKKAGGKRAQRARFSRAAKKCNHHKSKSAKSACFKRYM